MRVPILVGMRITGVTKKLWSSVPCQVCGVPAGQGCRLYLGGLRLEAHVIRIQTAVLIQGMLGVIMEQLKSLQREYDENATRLAHPLDIAEPEQLKERRQVILRETRALAQEMNVPGPQWLYLA